MTFPSFFRSALLGSGAMLLCIGGILLAGCDGTGSKRDSLYERLTETGPWTIERLEGSGFDFGDRLERRYPRGAEITFREDDGSRTYEILRQRSEGSPSVVTQGAVVLPGDNVLQMVSGLEGRGPVTWRYNFPTTSRAKFEAQSGPGAGAFLGVLLSEGNPTPDLKMTLAATGN